MVLLVLPLRAGDTALAGGRRGCGRPLPLPGRSSRSFRLSRRRLAMRADSSRLGVESEWCTFAVNGRFDFSAPRRGPRRGPLGSKAPAKAAKQYACPMDQVGSIYLLLLAARFVWEPTRGTQRRPWSGIVSGAKISVFHLRLAAATHNFALLFLDLNQRPRGCLLGQSID